MPHALSSGLPKDFLRPCLLLLLREGDAHGYQLADSLEAFGFDHSDPGALYRALRRLESDGLVRLGLAALRVRAAASGSTGSPSSESRSSTAARPTSPRASGGSTPFSTAT